MTMENVFSTIHEASLFLISVRRKMQASRLPALQCETPE
jgi:hypothetical protein